jgi:tRNA(Ile2) C34 agmatinyltransferase TiaS
VGSIPNQLGTRRAGNQKCPFCAETIKSQAIKCRYCGSDLADHEKRGGV